MPRKLLVSPYTDGPSEQQVVIWRIIRDRLLLWRNKEETLCYLYFLGTLRNQDVLDKERKLGVGLRSVLILDIPAWRVVWVQSLQDENNERVGLNYTACSNERINKPLTSRERRCSTTQSSFTVGLRI